VVVLGLILLSFGVSPPADLHATQAPSLSLDMVTAGNGYSDPGSGGDNSMAVGAIDQCVQEAGNNNAHNRTAHLIVQNVEDLAGVQARFNFDSSKAAVTNFISAPFQDTSTLQNVGFLNLPLDPALGNNHRDLTGASDFSRTNTALVSASYLGEQTFPISPDTPAKSPTPDDTSYSAPSGGIVGTVIINVRAGQLGQPSLYVDLDDGDPEAPGSSVDIFTSNGIEKVALASSALKDGFIGNGVPCLPVAPPSLPLPSPPSGGAGGNSPNDSDGDGFSDAVEDAVYTNPSRGCGTSAWPADINNDTFSEGTDITTMAGSFSKPSPRVPQPPEQPQPGAPARYNLYPDGFVDGTDFTVLVGFFNRRCFVVNGAPDGNAISPYDGYWDRFNLGASPPEHERSQIGCFPICYGPGDWAADFYAPPGTSVRFYGSSDCCNGSYGVDAQVGDIRPTVCADQTVAGSTVFVQIDEKRLVAGLGSVRSPSQRTSLGGSVSTERHRARLHSPVARSVLLAGED